MSSCGTKEERKENRERVRETEKERGRGKRKPSGNRKLRKGNIPLVGNGESRSELFVGCVDDGYCRIISSVGTMTVGPTRSWDGFQWEGEFEHWLVMDQVFFFGLNISRRDTSLPTVCGGRLIFHDRRSASQFGLVLTSCTHLPLCHSQHPLYQLSQSIHFLFFIVGIFQP
jgi:hypothetical protein